MVPMLQGLAWSSREPWVFASVSYDGRVRTFKLYFLLFFWNAYGVVLGCCEHNPCGDPSTSERLKGFLLEVEISIISN